MPLTKQQIESAPSIELGGRRFYIPPLGIRQNRIVISGLKKLLPLMQEFEKVARDLRAKMDAAKAAGVPEAEAETESGFGLFANFPIDDDTFDALCAVVHAAITRAYPEFTRADFDDLPIGVDELIQAIPVCTGQSFAFSRREANIPAPEALPAETPVPTI